ncbi:MAG: type phosphodiesterase/nucleotide pyrophosphatase [Herbinix sp.]|jgi:predicted AlkP superfamily pyrophosphatase or phosphodiesterase|nr:type phosphodiesterase/nucleotide pyrophosphatase [Herbinix sp.]
MGTGKSKHLVVISYDAFSEDNWEKASKLPNLSKLIKNGAYSTKLKSVYPTLTYVVHTTMVTGVYPDKHGIYHNNPLQPFINEKEQSWFWFKKDIKVPAVYDALKKHRMKSAGILWPVTGKASIRYNIPEIRAIKNENQALKILKNGSPFFSIGMEKKFGHLRRGIEQPYLDNFTTRIAVDTIKRKKPNLLLMHLIDLDDAKHEHGTDSLEIEKVLIRMDQRLGDIIEAVREAGLEEDTVFLVLGDHGQINVRYKVRLNQLLKEEGLIYEEKGEMKWRAYIQNAGGAAYLHVKDNDTEAELLALDIIKKAMTEECYGIERLYNRKELDNYQVASSVGYMLEAKAGFCFEDSLDGPVVTDLEELGIKYATHGFSPNKPEYKCVLVISGACIKKEYQLGEVNMVDIAPTIASILGIDFYNCDGKSLNEIFR